MIIELVPFDVIKFDVIYTSFNTHFDGFGKVPISYIVYFKSIKKQKENDMLR